MTDKTIPIDNVVKVNLNTSLPAPLNLSFLLRKVSDDTLQQLAGPGLYLIRFDDEVIYLGKYQPIGGKILTDRWLRHLETITLRGKRVGFGASKNPDKKLNSLLKQVSNPDLQSALQNIFMNHYEDRIKDTGVVTAKNRVGFADENWNYFSGSSDNSILDKFSITLLRLSGIASQSQASSLSSSIESQTLNTIKPRCNKEFSEKPHHDLRINNTLEAVIEHVTHIARDHGVDFTHRTTLLGSEFI
ncbi:MAG TPA: hypothetical protein VIM93_12070 [Kangiella sp.]